MRKPSSSREPLEIYIRSLNPKEKDTHKQNLFTFPPTAQESTELNPLYVSCEIYLLTMLPHRAVYAVNKRQQCGREERKAGGRPASASAAAEGNSDDGDV